MKRIALLSPLFVATSFGAAVATFQTDWATDAVTGASGSSTAIGGNFTQQDWETTDPNGAHNFVDVIATYADITGQRLFYRHDSGVTATTTITVTGVPAFQSISIDQLIVGAGGGIDGVDNADGIEVVVDGISVLNVDLSARAIDPPANARDSTYNTGATITAPAGVVLEGPANGDSGGSEFINTRTNGWGHDALYDLGADPAFDNVQVSGSGNVTIEIIARLSNGSGGVENGTTDEQLVIGNFDITFDDAVPEPSSALLAAISALTLLRRRR